MEQKLEKFEKSFKDEMEILEKAIQVVKKLQSLLLKINFLKSQVKYKMHWMRLST